ncbi:hypothetical protein FMM58_07890 [Campylobacter sp. LR291e]|uniref:EI24 domain-containing protein n=1 Tax=Campylobacter sp. LR291e TaxID=2593546 RepID=UPI00123A9D8B|nr:EI24 domain-containing protein [Campylobacter sp. LR291e]KAA6229271.1 hypothetical protein FMM58_07890 [Campylobacter sp. LR291e]
MSEILKLSISDSLSKQFLKFSLLPLFFSFVLFILLCYFGFSSLFDYFDEFFSGLEEGSFFAWLYSLAFVHVLIVIFSFLLSSFVVIIVSVFFSMFIVSFLTPFIVASINKKHYHYKQINSVNFFKIILKIIWIFVKFIFLFGVASFLLFFPFVNLFIYNVVFYYLFHKLLMLDVASCVLDKDNFENFYAKTSPIEFKFATLIFYIIACIPVCGLIFQVFFVIFLTHLFYQRILKLKA